MSLMPHHTSNPVCELCEFKLKSAHPLIADWYRTKVKPTFKDAHISWSYRGKDDQEQAFADGKSKLHYPNSQHNKTDSSGNPQSTALDLFEIDDSGQAIFNPKFYAQINAMNVDQKLGIAWGHIFKSLGDDDHFALIPD